jgi:putative phosphoesterase
MVHIPGPSAGRARRLRATFPGCDAIVYGHTHAPEATKEKGVWILNPGSPTERRTSPTHAMLVLEVEGGSVRPTLIEL